MYAFQDNFLFGALSSEKWTSAVVLQPVKLEERSRMKLN